METIVSRNATALAMIALAVTCGFPSVSPGESFFEKQNKAAQDAAKQRQQRQQQQQSQQPQQQQPQQQQTAPQSLPAAHGQQPGLPADFGTPEGTAGIAASMRFVDVVGIKLGMEMKDVLPALKAANPSYQVNTFHAARDTSTPPQSGPVVGVHATLPNPGKTPYPETLDIVLTGPPGAGYVYGISRSVPFPPGAQPTLANLVDSLRKKYGLETANPDSVNNGFAPLKVNNGYFWAFDGQGKLMGWDQNAQLRQETYSCFGGGAGQAAGNVLETFYVSFNRELDLPSSLCHKLMIVSASLQLTPNGLVNALVIGAQSYMLGSSGRLATWNWLDQQAKAEAEKEREDAKKVGAPKL